MGKKMFITETMLTQKEAERAKRNADIKVDFALLRQQNPDATTNRVVCRLALKYGVTSTTIRNVLAK